MNISLILSIILNTHEMLDTMLIYVYFHLGKKSRADFLENLFFSFCVPQKKALYSFITT